MKNRTSWRRRVAGHRSLDGCCVGDTIDNPGSLEMDLADSYSPFLEFASSDVAHQENYWILGEMYSDGTYLFTDAYTDCGLLPYTVAGQSLSAQLFIYDVNGTVDGITQEITWQIDARVKFKAGSALSTCQTSIFTIDVYGDYGATETFVSDPFTVPALTAGCGGATNIAAINTALSLGSSGASLTLPKFGLSPVPTGS